MSDVENLQLETNVSDTSTTHVSEDAFLTKPISEDAFVAVDVCDDVFVTTDVSFDKAKHEEIKSWRDNNVFEEVRGEG